MANPKRDNQLNEMPAIDTSLGTETKDDLKLLLTPNEAAHRLSISRSYLYQLLQSGAIPSIRLGLRARRISVNALEQFIADQTAEVIDSHTDSHGNGYL